MSIRRLLFVAGLVALALAPACSPPSRPAQAGAPDAPPQRIVPTNASAVDYTLALVDPARVAAIPDKAFDYAFLDLPPEDWTDRTFGRYVGETVLGLDPDLVLTHAWQSADATRIIKTSGVPVVELPDLHTFADVLGTLERLGVAFAAEERAAELTAELEARRRALVTRKPTKPHRVLPYSNFGSTGWTAGGGTTIDIAIELAGVTNAATEAGLEGHVKMDNERLLSIDPDYILVGTAPRDPGYSTGAAYLRTEPSLQGLRAVREGRMIVLNAKWLNASSHHVMDAAEALRDAIE